MTTTTEQIATEFTTEAAAFELTHQIVEGMTFVDLWVGHTDADPFIGNSGMADEVATYVRRMFPQATVRVPFISSPGLVTFEMPFILEIAHLKAIAELAAK